MSAGYLHIVTILGNTYYYDENNLLSRTDGPAIDYANGDKKWWVNGVELTEEEFNLRFPPKPIELPKVKSKYKF
jgi:hypothetical protein